MVAGLIAAAVALVPSPAHARASADAAPAGPYVAPRSEVRIVTARSGARYRLYLSWPDTPPPAKGYPVLYLLDGDVSFPLAAATVNGLGPYFGLQPGILVGIGYPQASRRGFDYTPEVPAGAEVMTFKGPSGGADAFLNFVADELQPMIKARFPVDADRQTLAGYSLGGLFVLHALFTRPERFSTYVASSPSIWFGDKRVLTGEAALPAKLAGMRSRRALYLTAGALEQTPWRPSGVSDETWRALVAQSARARLVDNARELDARLEERRIEGLTVDFQLMPGETHASGPYAAIRAALERAFSPID